MKKRIFAFLLAAAMLLPVAACGTVSDNPANTMTPDITDTVSPIIGTPLEHVFTEAVINTPSTSVTGMITNLLYINDKIYYDTDNTQIMSINTDGTGEVCVYEIAAVTGETALLMSFAVDDAGSVWTVVNRSFTDTTDSANPMLVSVLTLAKTTGETEVLSFDLSNTEGMPPRHPQRMVLDSNGNVYLHDGAAVYVFNGETAEHIFTVTDSYVTSLARTSDGKAAYLSSMENAVKVIDFESQSTQSIALDGTVYTDRIFDGVDKYGFFYLYMNKLWGFNTVSAVSEVVVDFVVSDITASMYYFVAPASTSELIAYHAPRAVRDSLQTQPGKIVRLVENPDATDGGKITLTLGVVTNLDDITREAVAKFNKSSSTARIEIKDYSVYNSATDMMGGSKQLDLDLLAGTAPDILGLALGFPPEKYAGKGILEDLTPYLDNDPGVSCEDLFESVLELGTTDGRLYHIIPVFSTLSLIGKASIFGDGELTFTEFIEICDGYPDSEISAYASRTTWLNMNINLRLANFVNWTNGTVNFTNDEFYALLESGLRFPDEIDFSYYTPTDYTQNDALVTTNMLLDPFYARNFDMQFGEAVSALNFHSEYGNYGTALIPVTDVAINSASAHKDIAWEFISGIISNEDYISMGSVSINKNAFEKRMAMEMIPLSQRDFTGGVTLFPTGGIITTIYSYDELDPAQYVGYELTEDEVARVREHIENASQMLNRDTTIIAIVQEEAAAFYGGVRSAQEAAALIQSRVQIYLDEQR